MWTSQSETPERRGVGGQFAPDPVASPVPGQARRNLTKGQQAMASAMIYPESGKGARGHKDEALNPERLRHRSLLFPQSEKPDKTHPEAEDHNSDKDPYDERAATRN
jgi:hypothetical protein